MVGVATNLESSASAIRRIAAERSYWRVKVETWQAESGVAGRFVFEPEGVVSAAARAGPPVLAAESREDLLRAAHDVSEERLRALCRSPR